MATNYLIVGGAGFIGCHFAEELLFRNAGLVRVVDNLCSGTLEHIAQFKTNRNFDFVKADVENTDLLADAMAGIDTVIHLASNPDIAKAATEPRIDFVQGTVLTESVVEAARISGVSSILYASGSGVYGDAGETELTEESKLSPISTYGASKLAGESLLASYSYMFGIKCLAFRFANVVGPKQTHGVGYDFLRQLKADPSCLKILGDGKQNKSYVHVTDVIRAVLMAEDKVKSGFEVFNISTKDQITVNAIAEIARNLLGIDKNSIRYVYTGGTRGWKADVPIVKLSAEKISSLGWMAQFGSSQAVELSLKAMKEELTD
jgi:UDP-glucose 4-epimerase